MFDMIKKAQEMQKNLKVMQDELKLAEVTGKAAGGTVTVVVSGTHELKSVHIKPEAVDARDVETLEDLVKVAVNDAISQANAMAEARVSKITGGLKIPGLLG